MNIRFEKGYIYFNKIIIIQSLPLTERQTGTEIHDDYLVRHAWLDPNLSVELLSITTKEEFIDSLTKIEKDTKSGTYLPFIHFETHGGIDGICLASGEYVRYKEFIGIIRKININTKNNLFISVGACWGGRIQFVTDIRKPCPFRGFIGPMEEIYDEDLVISFSTFFAELLKTNDFDLAIKRLNQSNNSGIDFHHYNAEAFLEELAKLQNVESLKNPDKREEFVISEARKRWDGDPRIRLYFKSREKFRAYLRKIAVKQLPKSYQDLQDNFLHVRIRNKYH
jgi:hypothetical protein